MGHALPPVAGGPLGSGPTARTRPPPHQVLLLLAPTPIRPALHCTLLHAFADAAHRLREPICSRHLATATSSDPHLQPLHPTRTSHFPQPSRPPPLLPGQHRHQGSCRGMAGLSGSCWMGVSPTPPWPSASMLPTQGGQMHLLGRYRIGHQAAGLSSQSTSLPARRRMQACRMWQQHDWSACPLVSRPAG